MPQETETQEETMTRIGRWLTAHALAAKVFLLALAVLNTYISSALLREHPLVATVNAAMAIILALAVILTW